ncbi:Maf family nucleotide pyrophosphatase [Salibacteraceae bacterium]|nr:Maf family nucleotide pyrophosphatase [Salibacteraceae bacterium]
MASSFQENFNTKWDLLLGSKSPRRKDLLSELGFDFQMVDIECNEDFPSNLKAEEIVSFLAKSKSEHYQKELLENDLLITADTIVWHKGEVLNKPADSSEAFQMISKLQNSFHEVITGVHLKSATKESTFTETTRVHFRALKDWQIEAYVNTDAPLDKAGAYGIQDWIGKIGVDRIEGCYNNVVGLPTAQLYFELSNFGKEQA